MRGLFFLLFAISGFSGLIYESIWTHYLKLFLGHAAYAQTLVLAIFMGGMALGAWLASRSTARWGNLLRGYALVEGAVGLAAVAFHPVFVGATGFAFDVAIPALGAPTAVSAFKWTLGALLILPQSVLLGMTFPLMTAGLIRRFPDRPGETVAMLYFTNSMGGALGVLASGFWMIATLGLPGTVGAAGVINLLLAALVWRLARSPETIPPPPAAQGGARGGAVLLLAAAGITGAASFIYEVGWIRMLSLVLGSSTHAFELMLSAFILGLAFGGLWIRGRIDRFANPLGVLAAVQVAMGLLALATLPVYGASFELMQWLMKTLPKTDGGYAQFNLASHGIALAVMLPATFCAGMTLPLITHVLLRAGHGEAAIGRVYAVNTVGAILGVFAAVHLGFTLLGLKGLITAGAVLDMGLGLVLALRAWPVARVPVAAGGVLAGLAAALLLVRFDATVMALGVYRAPQSTDRETLKVIDHRDGKTATVHLTEAGDVMAIRTNGKIDASVRMDPGAPPQADEATMILAAALPLMMKPDARLAANIGMGSGMSTHTLLTSGTLERVDTIEIERAMVELARRFGEHNRLAYSDPRSHIHIEDAKTFFSTRGGRYDIIVSEPSNPWVSGVSGLFSREFYALVKRHLAPGGLLVQWLQLYEIDLPLVMSMLKALDEHFADYVVYSSNDGDILVVASADGAVPAPGTSLFGIPAFDAQLRRAGVLSPADIALRRVADRRLLHALLPAFPLPANSDYLPVVDQNAARTRFLGASASDMTDFGSEPVPAAELLELRAPPSGPAPVLDYSGLAQARSTYFAAAFRDALAATPPGTPPRLDAGLSPMAAANVRALLGACAAPPAGDRVFVLFDVALKVAPWLAPLEMEQVWGALSAWPCASGLGPDEQRWLDLFRAVGRRDAPAMAALAEQLLDAGTGMTPARGRYLMAVGLLGSVAASEPERAARLVQRHGARVHPDGLPWLLARGLAVLAGAVPAAP